ncbi:short-chain dehydrogenase [Sphingomonas oleivorans]|uniref:Short-chain dehydrogenase n=1 Tax=Sphingomonas oleivorans TaxID=1735121 RepID=A0A2T5FYX8_9SPHN|nr:SDR family oxidoreductase [Sphingomonas oleivorans]PTQ11802.1 short-chain dehydrogenase [Sphingomonas oleivorans]
MELKVASVEGLRILVTAGASSIGRAIAEAFVAAGSRVHICDIDAALLEQTLQEQPLLRGTLADVGSPQSLDRLFEDAAAWLGGFDVLVNNAGVGGPRALLENVAEDAWDDCIRVNLGGPFYCMKRVIPFMKAQRSGCILNISTSSARTGLPERSPYVASKAGLIALNANAARELGPWNIRCNAILPGVVDNPRGNALIERFGRDNSLSPDQARETFLRYVSMRSMIGMDEIAAMAVFLASPAARHVSGQAIGVCGNVEWES